jgi:hypothetical protein
VTRRISELPPLRCADRQDGGEVAVSDVVPIGYVTILQAADMLEAAMFAGSPDAPAVTQLRETGVDVGEGAARNRTLDEIWKAVDEGTLQPCATGGKSRKIMKLSAAITKQIPILRSPAGRGFTHLRASNPAFDQVARWFGRQVSKITLLFAEHEVRRLAARLRRRRRKSPQSKGLQRGRSSMQAAIEPVIRGIVDRGEWTGASSIKTLSNLVNRQAELPKAVSEDTVGRVVARIYKETNDRRCERHRRRREPRRMA